MNNKSSIAIFVAFALVVGFFVGQNAFHVTPRAGSIVVHNVSESFDAGVDVQGTNVIDSNRNITAATLTIGSGGTAISNRICGSNTAYNPASLANNATTTQDVTVTGAVAGDTCHASLSSATTSQAFLIGCNVWAAGSTTVTIHNLGGTIDYATGTLKVCTTH